ncbi:MAG: hypothetical protein HZB50_13810 [Chloroflexi bacterium]|nr:hypothetical protein [Chloroflexota bacterium]
MKAKENIDGAYFNQDTIRLLIGGISFFLPLVIRIFASIMPDSISWSFYTHAHNWFVGLLFVIGALLMSYKGRNHIEDLVGWVGGFAAWTTALNPTSYCYGKDNCPPFPDPMPSWFNITYPNEFVPTVHYVGAIILFLTTVYFCLGPFTSRVKEKIKDDPTGIHLKFRLYIYQFCGWGILVTMGGLVVMSFAHINILYSTFWGETIALVLFGFAWMIASKYLPVITAEDERNKNIFEQQYWTNPDNLSLGTYEKYSKPQKDVKPKESVAKKGKKRKTK